MKKKRYDKKSDLSTEFLQSLVDQDSQHTVSILQGTTDPELRALVVSMSAVLSMLLTYAVKRGIDISKEAAIVIEIPGDGEKN